MKRKIINLVIKQLLLSGGILFLTGFMSGTGDTPVALVKKVVKDVTFRGSESTAWENAKAGVALIDGNEIKTGSKSLALVLFTDGSGILRVRENSSLQIYGKKDNNRIDKNTYIDKGEVGFEVSKQQNEEFTFTTPTVVASIRGTDGYVGVASDSTTTIMCNTGNILLNSQMGSKQVNNVTGGNTAIIGKDGSISITVSTGDEMKKYRRTQSVETKKIQIQSNKGLLEIEYLPEEK